MDLELEGSSGDVLDTKGNWVWSSEGWNSHDHDRSVKLALDLDSLPVSLLHLLDGDFSVFDDSISLDSR